MNINFEELHHSTIKRRGNKFNTDNQVIGVRNGREETPDDSQSTSTFSFTAFFMESACLSMIHVSL